MPWPAAASDTTSWSLLRQAVDETAGQLVGLLRSVRNPNATAIGEWSIRDVAVHLADVFTNYPRYLMGDGPLFADPMQITAHNAEVVAAGRDMQVEEAADRIASSALELSEMLATRRPDERVTWHGGIDLGLRTFVAVPLSDGMIHAHDIATAEDRSFKPDPAHAAATLINLADLLPHYVNPQSAAGFSAVYELRPRGGERRLLTFRNGSLTVSTEGRTPDCIVSADAYSFMLIGYNRLGQIRAALTGKVVAWGRKPWLALKLPNLIASP